MVQRLSGHVCPAACVWEGGRERGEGEGKGEGGGRERKFKLDQATVGILILQTEGKTKIYETKSQ